VETTIENQLSLGAKIYLTAVAALAAAIAVPQLAELSPSRQDWVEFVLLAGAAAVAQLFVVKTPHDQSYHTSIVFVMPAVFLLPLELVVLMAVVQHVPEWLKVRYPWFIQSFNICNHTTNLVAAWATAEFVLGAWPGGEKASIAVAGLAASAVYVASNHILLGVMLKLGRGHGFRETGLFSLESLTTDLVLAGLGILLAVLWSDNPWLIPAVVAPLILIHRSLSVPALQEEARVDPKTGLYNARHFTAQLREELARAERFDRPMSIVMADLDLLRDINNSYGHLAGDAVLKGIATIFMNQLRHYDVPARFGGEEFAILLPETAPEQALEIAERIRRTVSETQFDVETSSEPIHATVSLGVAGYPKHGSDANELIHQADLAVYRAKLQGRNRALSASSEPLLVPAERDTRLAAVPEDGDFTAPAPRAIPQEPQLDRREAQSRPHAPAGPRFVTLSPLLATVVVIVSAGGIAAGALEFVLGSPENILGLLAVVALVAGGQALALEFEGGSGSISVSAVGALAGVAIFGPHAALPLAIAIAAVAWSWGRTPIYYLLFNVGALTLASLGAAAVFSFTWQDDGAGRLLMIAAGLVAGGVYYVVNTGLTSAAMALEGHDAWRRVWKERFSWLFPHYFAFGAVAAAIALAYTAIGFLGLVIFVLPLLLMRKTMAAYLGHTERSTKKLRHAAQTIRNQNVSLEQANRLLRERSTAAMESLSATVDARDAYTAGHSRRVQQLALAIGRELGLSQGELDLLGHAALFHDIGKLAVPDAILLKPSTLTDDEWALMQRHSDEGARIIDRLGFLNDAVPAIRHHHERFDGTGYPDRLAGEDIPLGARIIHVADALDSMLTTRIYRAARPAHEALEELRRGAGSQFCPRCVTALERLLRGELEAERVRAPALATAS
jgi:diguanylate cyclase (GGDEF)-like protein/putative nucleotidyltransferase with HDIG domain